MKKYICTLTYQPRRPNHVCPVVTSRGVPLASCGLLLALVLGSFGATCKPLARLVWGTFGSLFGASKTFGVLLVVYLGSLEIL